MAVENSSNNNNSNNVHNVRESTLAPTTTVPATVATIANISMPEALELAAAARRHEFLAELGRSNPTYQQWLSTLSTDQQHRVRSSANRMKHGLHAVAPLTCKGPKRCPFIDACPIPARTATGIVLGPETQYPIGLPCVLEGEYMAQKIADYVQYLSVDPANPIELAIVNELALIDLKKNRALLILSHGDRDGQGRDFLHVDESVAGFSDNGTPFLSKTTKIHPVAEYIDKLERRREKWLDKLMETRKSKADYAVKIGDTDKESKVLREIQAIRIFVEKMRTEPTSVGVLTTREQREQQDDYLDIDEDYSNE